MSPLPVEFHPAAESEALEAARWYAQHDAATAERFLWALDRAVEQVAAAPAQWPSYLHGTRRVPLARYPFTLVYRLRTGSVLVLAVAHQRRVPGYWRRR